MGIWPRRSDKDFSAEVQAHLDQEAARLIEDGMSSEDARAAARRAFGNVLRAQERFHESTHWAWLEQFVQDVRYAARGLRKSPAFVASTVITLAVGLGLLTVAFTVFNALVLRPFAVHSLGHAVDRIERRWRIDPDHRSRAAAGRPCGLRRNERGRIFWSESRPDLRENAEPRARIGRHRGDQRRWAERCGNWRVYVRCP